VRPVDSFKILAIPVVLYFNWQLLPLSKDYPNPFGAFFLLSHPVSDSPPDDPRYAKGYYDLLFIAYYIVFFSLVRQLITINLCRPIARYFGIRKEGKLDRFGEQGYAFIYFGIMGAWGYVSYLSLLVSLLMLDFSADYGPAANVVVPHRIFLDRLSSLGYETRAEALLPYANVLLDSTTSRSRSGS